MNLDELRQHIRELKSQWDSLQPLKPEDERRLWQKLRLEWNYNSNHIEGNTLTYGETVNFLLHDQTTGNHTGREYEEIKAHDAAVEWVRKLAQESNDLSEADIRNLNQLLLKEAFWKEAFTPDGQPTRIEVKPGQYKTAPNSVKTVTGEIVNYVSPADVPIRMAKLVEFLKDGASGEQVELGLFLAKVHDEFLLIHPFDDGNGRVARLLINYVLLRKGYPPIIIKSADKKNYLTALRQADVGEIAALEEYLLRQLEWSLELGIKAAKGESIEEPSDVEKEIEIFVRERTYEKERNTSEVELRSQQIGTLCERSLQPLFVKFLNGYRKFKELFCSFKALTVKDREPQVTPSLTFKAPYANKSIGWMITLSEYQGKSPVSLDLTLNLEVRFLEREYQIWIDGVCMLQREYAILFDEDEQSRLVQACLKRVLDNIKQYDK